MADIDKLISFSSTGLSVATAREIREVLVDKFKEVYGSDIDTSTASVDGIYIDNLVLLINSILQNMSGIYTALDIRQATGRFLDSLCALSGIYRKSATKSSTTLNVTLSSPNSITFNSLNYNTLKFVDKDGKTWTLDISAGDVTLVAGTPSDIKVTCDTEGAIEIPASWITATAESTTYIFSSITQPNACIVGTEKETDAELKSRRAQSITSLGRSSVDSLKGAVLNETGVKDIYLYNGDKNSTITALDGTSVYKNTIYAIIARNTPTGVTTLDELDKLIGKIIYNKMTPGIPTDSYAAGSGSEVTGFAKTYTYNVFSEGGTTISQVINWKEAKPIDTISIAITLVTSPYYEATTAQASIKQAVISYLNSLGVAQTFTANDLINVVNSRNIDINGKVTYFCSNVVITSTSSETTKALVYDSTTGIYQLRDTYFYLPSNFNGITFN